MRDFFLLLVGCLCSFFIQAQQNADLLISFDKEALQLATRKTDSDFLQRLENHYLEKVGENANLIQQIYEQPEALGLSTENHLIGFVDIQNGFAHIGIQFPLADAALFESKVREFGVNTLENVTPISTAIENEAIRAQLMQSRERQLEKRQALFQVRAIAGSESKYVLGSDWTLAWTATYGFLLQTQALDAGTTISFNADQYSIRTQEIEEAKLNYIATLSPTNWRDQSSDVVMRFAAPIASRLNELTTNSAEFSPMSLLFDREIELSLQEQRIKLNFENAALLVESIENGDLRQQQIWSREELARNWNELEIEEGEDSLDIWLKVLGQRFQF